MPSPLNKRQEKMTKYRKTSQKNLTFATKFSMSFLEVSLEARGPHWKQNSGGSVRGMGVISRYLQGAGG